VEAYLVDWANLLVRWLHLISGIAWIGASFYFVMLDLSLRKPVKAADAERGVSGELWAVHGGGVYQSQKFLAGPRGEPLSQHLHWSKWEAYTTWLSGMGLLAIIYWLGANTYLIDPQVRQWTEAEAVGLSIAVLVVSWLVYDYLCRLLGQRENLLAAVLLVYIVVCDWLLFQVFSARAAYIHVGAIMGTMMAANVFFHIIPGQKKMLAQIRAGQEPDPRYGIIGKQRSVHNTYFTLPVLFIMISNHYPMTYAHPQGWLVLILVMLAGVLIRQFFVLRHSGQLRWWLPGVALGLLAMTFIWLKPDIAQAGGESVSFTEVEPVIQQRCASCHASVPTQAGFVQAPKGIVLQTPQQIQQHATLAAQTIQSGYMPIGNLTGMTDEERALFIRWAAQGAVTD
jgi:uncharacterized membrane protein